MVPRKAGDDIAGFFYYPDARLLAELARLAIFPHVLLTDSAQKRGVCTVGTGGATSAFIAGGFSERFLPRNTPVPPPSLRPSL
jgi:hypothetical protein